MNHDVKQKSSLDYLTLEDTFNELNDIKCRLLRFELTIKTYVCVKEKSHT